MAIKATCSCGAQFAARADLAGKRVKCLSCGSVLSIPKPQLTTVTCQCGRVFEAKPELAGTRARFPCCGRVVTIPWQPQHDRKIRAYCSKCACHYLAASELAGRIVACPRCRAPITVGEAFSQFEGRTTIADLLDEAEAEAEARARRQKEATTCPCCKGSKASDARLCDECRRQSESVIGRHSSVGLESDVWGAYSGAGFGINDFPDQH